MEADGSLFKASLVYRVIYRTGPKSYRETVSQKNKKQNNQAVVEVFFWLTFSLFPPTIVPVVSEHG